MKASEWRKSSRSGSGGSNCVEARTTEVGYQVRDSKLSDDSPVFSLKSSDFSALLFTAREN